jgi:hypothetical protein
MNGIPVLNNRLAFVYENDGDLRSINGKWHKIDYSKSQYNTEITLNDIVDMATRIAISKKVNPDYLNAIKFNTGYIVEKNVEGYFVLNLILEMSMDNKNMGDDRDNMPYDSLIIDI